MRPRHAAIALLSIAAAFLPACTSARTFVLANPGHPAQRPNTVHLVELPPTMPVEDDIAAAFRESLLASLREQSMLESGAGGVADITLQYRFVQFDEGSGFVRVGQGAASLLGSPFAGAGDGSVGVEVVFLDSRGERIGHIVADGPIAGFFGTASGGAESAAENIADYTRDHFAPAPAEQASADEA